jgi:hypothetical protein
MVILLQEYEIPAGCGAHIELDAASGGLISARGSGNGHRRGNQIPSMSGRPACDRPHISARDDLHRGDRHASPGWGRARTQGSAVRYGRRIGLAPDAV